jgi:hypothetical protein
MVILGGTKWMTQTTRKYFIDMALLMPAKELKQMGYKLTLVMNLRTINAMYFDWKPVPSGSSGNKQDYGIGWWIIVKIIVLHCDISCVVGKAAIPSLYYYTYSVFVILIAAKNLNR